MSCEAVLARFGILSKLSDFAAYQGRSRLEPRWDAALALAHSVGVETAH